MEIIKINPKKPNIEAIRKAARVMKNGGAVIYPTDTSYGIGVSAFDKEAIKKVFKIKGRNFNNPISVIVRSLRTTKTIAEINKEQEKYFLKKLPGPFTLIFKKKKIIPLELTAGLDTVGIRIPDCLITELLGHETIIPYTTTSANVSGQPACYSLDELLKQFKNNEVDLILDAGKLVKNKLSTVIDLSKNKPRTLRH